jgi:FkbM family methyltransferase
MLVSKEFDHLLKVIETEVEGHSHWVWPIADLGCWDAITKAWLGGQREAYLQHTPHRRNVAVQAGGNCGLFPRLLNNHFQRVYTFEPDFLNFHCLTLNCQKENIFKMQAALGSSPRMVDLDKSWDWNVGGFTVRDGNNRIPMITVDSLNLDTCDLLQLDVEHHDYQALLGSVNTINKFQPVVSVEYCNDEIYRLMNMLNYVEVEKSYDDSIFVPRKR